ncbi:MAG: radical SAM protein [Oscillospiraceae bacterium]|jgi:hypothetical protein|nr:radical SAM protein [Oscillospiraceae bacterium]
MNPYLQNLNRVEFLVTFACTGRCKHCSEGDHVNSGEHINGDAAADMVYKVAGKYAIKSLMTFGGEPLLYPEEVYKIHIAARNAGIANRQLITNGFFSRDDEKIKHVAKTLFESGVNDIMLSVDAFHQETIPIEPVVSFASALQGLDIPKLHVHPAWLVSKDADNPYNNKTREILSLFTDKGIPVSSGNVIFPGGNALKYLNEYFDLSVPHISPYAENPYDITAICVVPNGGVLNGNIYQSGILDIIKDYTPEEKRG